MANNQYNFDMLKVLVLIMASSTAIMGMPLIILSEDDEEFIRSVLRHA